MRAREVQAYDFRSREKFSRETLRQLGQLCEHATRVIAAEWTALLRAPVRFQLDGVVQMPIGDAWERALPSGSVLVYVAAAPLPGLVTFSLDGEVAAAIVDRAAGGSLRARARRIQLTETEEAVLRYLCAAVTEGLSEGFRRHVELRPQVARIELLQEASVPPAAPGDACAIAVTAIRVGDGPARPCHIVFPHVTLEPVLGQLHAQAWPQAASAQGDRATSLRRMQEHLLALPVVVRATIGGRRVPLAEQLGWQVGRVVPLGARQNAECHLLVGSCLLASGAIHQDPDTGRLAVIVRSLARSLAKNGGDMPMDAQPAEQIDLSAIGQVELLLSVEVGRASVRLGDLLRWQPDMVIELDRMSGEPLSLLLNGVPVAQGEIVVDDNDQLGIRITEILEPKRDRRGGEEPWPW